MIQRATTGFLVIATLAAQDWNQWRGPNRDGVLAGFTAPATWPSRLSQKWKLQVGEGHSSPLIAGGRAFVFARVGDEEQLTAVDLRSGRLLWRNAYRAPYEMHPAAVRHGKGPKSTPLLQDGRIYTLGISGVLSCHQAADGRLVWRREFSQQYQRTAPLYGSAMSPVLEGGLLIGHVGGHDRGALTAFDARTGEPQWVWNGDGPGYASPVIAEFHGVRQVITQSQRHVIGLASRTGELLWKIPFTTAYDQNSVSPVVYRDLVIYSGVGNPIVAMRISRQDGQWKAVPAWQNRQLGLYMNTPVLDGERLFGLSHRNRGQFFCLNAATGETVWTGEPRQGDNAAIVMGGGVLFLLKDDGEMLVARAAARWEPLARYTLADSPTWAHAVVREDGILVKDFASLAWWTWR